MIVLWGASEDPPTQRVAAALAERSAEFLQLEDRDLAALHYHITLAAQPSGRIELKGRRISLDQIQGVYLRPGDPAPGAAAAASATLLAVAACLPVTVINQPAAGTSNFSKPFQLRLIGQAGFAIPDTLVTTDPRAARKFLEWHGRLAYKSVSGVRSIVATLAAGDAERLEGVRTGPVQLQRWIDGLDVRVHVVGDRCFATAIECEADDYRYAARAGAALSMTAYEIPSALAQRLVALTRRMGLLVSGIDLRLSPDGSWYCFEVNPSPGFTFYEDGTGQPIAGAIADLLIRHTPTQ